MSVEHVRDALEKPASRLTLTDKKADFTIDIRERQRFERLVKPLLDFTVGPGVPQSALFTSPFGSQPLVSVDLLSMAMAAASAVNMARKAYAKHAEREDVRRTIAAYCDAQPNHGGGIQICETKPR